MKALRFHGRRDLRVESLREPGRPGPRKVRIRDSFRGICGTDLDEYLAGPIFIPVEPHRLTHARAPSALGHEFSGRAVEVDRDVTSVRAGDRASSQPLVAPFTDVFSQRGHAQLSDGLGLIGLSWPWGERAELAGANEDNVAKLPDTVTDEQGATIKPAAVAVHAVDKGRIRAGSSVLATGARPIGALACLAASAAGVTTILVAETNTKRRERIHEIRVVTAVFDPDTATPARAIADHTEGDRGVDVAIECVGHEKALGSYIASVRRRGTIVQVGLLTKPWLVDVSALVTKDITLEGSGCCETTMWPCAISLVASGLPVERVISARIPLDDTVLAGFDVQTVPGRRRTEDLITTAA